MPDQILPEFLQASFWDCDFAALSWEKQRDFIIRRLLQAGDWRAVSWLRTRLISTTQRVSQSP